MKMTSKSGIRVTSALGLATAVGLLAGSPAAALDGKVYPGVQCVGSTYGNTALVHGANGSAINISTEMALAVCPIVTDNDANQAGLNVARIRVNESGDTGNSSQCALYAVSENGFFIDGNFNSVTGSGQKTISIPFSTSPVRARYQLSCWLSGFSGLTQYEIEEK